MKYAILILLSMLGIACHSSSPQLETTNRQDEIVYTIDIAQTKIELALIQDGFPVRVYVGLQEGQLIFKSGVLTSANLKFDMNTLGLDAKDSSDKAIRTAQLMDTASFAVAKFPMAQFNLHSALALSNNSLNDLLKKDVTHQIEGDLMLKGIVKPIAFYAKLLLHDRTLTMDAYPQLNLKDWSISGFSDQKKLTPVNIHLVANRQ